MPTRGFLWCTTMALFFSLTSQPARAVGPGVDLPPVLEDTFGRDRGLVELAKLAIAADDTAAHAAQARLRAMGPAGLHAFERVHGPALDAARDAIAAAADATIDRRDPAGLSEPARARLLAALDTVCAQRDCVLSRLYWHTDLDEAVRTARREGKPILSLRLLGDLRDELSCANSRLFRAVLYPDPAVRAVLRDRFVLHWSSERPAPKITVDLGGGKTITTTVTGNSAHFVLDSGGRPVDVVPGLYAPAEFTAALGRAETLARSTVALTGAAHRKALAAHHQDRLRALDDAWTRLTGLTGQRVEPLLRARRPGNGPPRAGEAAPLAISKMAVEAPLLVAIGEPVERSAVNYEQIADRTAPAVVLSRATLGLMRTQHFRSGDATRDTAALATAIQSLHRTLALDTLRNEQEIHREIHGWWTNGAPADLQTLVRRVYDELFFTPGDDPWLGLADPSIYGGLVGGGRRTHAHL